MDVGTIAERRYWKAADARVVVDAWRASGLSMAAFARDVRCSEKRLARWVKSLGRGREEAVRNGRAGCDATRPADEVALQFVELARPASPPVLEVEIGGAVVRVPRGFDAVTLRQIVAALASPC